MKIGDEFILDIKRLGINGEGIGYYNKLAIFVNNALPKEGHKVRVSRVENKMAFAESLEILHKSSDRIEPLCPFYNECGGCNTMHIKYDSMCNFKRDMVIEAISRYTKLNPRSFEIRQTVKSDLEYNYRNRSILPVSMNKDHKLELCMIKSGTNHHVFIKDCLVHDKLINEINEKILKFADELSVSSYNPKIKRGILRFVSVRVNSKNDAMVCFVCYEKSNLINKLAKKVISIPEVKSVYMNYNPTLKQGNIFSEDTTLLEGEEYLEMYLDEYKYKVMPTTFFQLNTNQASKMNSIILKACKLSKQEVVVDAYCGVGSISLYLAKLAKKVIGIEYDKFAIELAKENAKLNGIKNTEFLQGDSAKVFKDMIKEVDVLVVDPPRTGLTDEFVNNILSRNIKRVVYVSCNPATFAKNLDKLSEKYSVSSITPLDMFPQCPNVELVATLNLK